MKSTGGSDEAKRHAGESAAYQVSDGDTVGLGTGSTAAHAIGTLGRRVEEGLDIRGVPTSYASREAARKAGVPLVPMADTGELDIAIDGADQVASDTSTLVKGGGAAHAREKIIDSSADRFLVVVDDSKLVDVITRAVPVEVLPDARAMVARRIREAGGEPELRTAKRKDGPIVTDNGNIVLDSRFGPITDPGSLAPTLSRTPGIVEHGLFVGMADTVHVGQANGNVDVLEF